MPFTGQTYTSGYTAPVCYTTASARPFFDDGAPREWTDALGNKHAACVYTPPAASASSKRPLVVFLPGTLGSAGSVYDTTSLRSKAPTFDLTGDGVHTGFILASANERNLQNASTSLAGPQWDHDYRDLRSPSCNPDINGLDTLIDTLVATGKVDPKRIYVMGWSAGATFSELYAFARRSTPTPGGNSVAAISSYAGYDPYNNLSDTQLPSCQLNPYPPTAVPLQMFHRACDALVACDGAQRIAFGLPPGDDVESWLTALAGTLGDPIVDDELIDYSGLPALACTGLALCGQTLGLENHIHWPDGVADLSGNDSEPVMLDFLRSHPLP